MHRRFAIELPSRTFLWTDLYAFPHFAPLSDAIKKKKITLFTAILNVTNTRNSPRSFFPPAFDFGNRASRTARLESNYRITSVDPESHGLYTEVCARARAHTRVYMYNPRQSVWTHCIPMMASLRGSTRAIRQ